MNGGNAPRRYRSKVSVKITYRFLAVALLPLAIACLVLIQVATTQLRGEAETSQKVHAADIASKVDSYIDTQTGQLAYIAELVATHPESTDQLLTALLDKNPDINKIEVFTIDRKIRIATPNNLSTSKMTSDNSMFDTLANKKRLLNIEQNSANLPIIAITLPILGPTGKTTGAIVGHYATTKSWESFLAGQQGINSYTYVVDSGGALVYHPDTNFLALRPDLSDVEAVRDFMGNSLTTRQTSSEQKQAVLSTIRTTKAGWGIITEEPITSVYSAFYTFMQVAIVTLVATGIGAALAALAFSRRTIRPIKKIITGARLLATGTLTQRIALKTKDELQELSDILNGIGGDMTNLVNKLESSNQNLLFEQSELQSIINNVNDGVIAVDAQGVIVSINASALRLVPGQTGDVRGKRITTVFPWSRDGAPLELDFTMPGFHTYENVVFAKDEAVSYLDLIVEVVDRDRNSVAAIITIHDQTASRELSVMKLDFVAIATHELRTPLTVIMGYLDMLNRDANEELSAENIENLNRAITGAQQLRELINKLLNIARIERGDMEIFLDKLNVTQLVKQNVHEHQPIAAEKQQTLVYTANVDTDIYAPADTTSITEVLNNLIGNALKYTPKGGRIRVHVTVDTENIRVEVADNGPGIPEELCANLFSKFYRAERSMIAGTRGTGLGLFISKTIIELQRGTIGVKSNVGSGSVFFFTLPIYFAERDDTLIEKNISRGKHGWFKKRPAHRG